MAARMEASVHTEVAAEQQRREEAIRAQHNAKTSILRRMGAVTQLEHELRDRLKNRAKQFADETEPLYAEIRRLHEVLGNQSQPGSTAITRLRAEVAEAKSE